jgi:putative flavoprotein involved in K+ transport
MAGRDGGRDIDLRAFALQGMKLYGVLKNVQGNILEFSTDLKQNLDNADATSENIKRRINEFIAKNNISAPEEAPYEPVWIPENETPSLDYKKANITSIVWCIGFGFDYSFVQLPIFDQRGLPIHQQGVTEQEGLYFLGLTWQHTWGSARFSGVGKDAEFLAEKISEKACVQN